MWCVRHTEIGLPSCVSGTLESGAPGLQVLKCGSGAKGHSIPGLLWYLPVDGFQL